MTPPKSRGSSAETGIDRAIDAWLESLEAGNYRRDARSICSSFARFLAEERSRTALSELSVLDCRRYAQHLRRRVRDEDDPLSAASAHRNGPYFTIVRSFLGWCVDDERLDANPARPNRVTEALPEYRGDRDRQFWPRTARKQLLSHVDRRVDDALQDAAFSDTAARRALRDRGVVAVLAFSGVRGAEVFRDPRDEYRNGLRWRDVDLDSGIARVLGKSREREEVALTDRVVRALEGLERAQDSDPAWPVFPTRHAPSLASAVRETLQDRGFDADEIDAILDDATAETACREHDVEPPALSKSGARSLMRRLCDDADVAVDGEYLKPHGGRRALGSELYEESAELAQETLRHASVDTTHEAYREKRAEDRRERIEDVLSDSGPDVS